MLRPIAEEILFGRMSMEVEIKLKSSLVLLLKTCSELIEVKNLWIDKLFKLIELTVEILATVAGSEISCNDSIGVEHWDDIKHIHAS